MLRRRDFLTATAASAIAARYGWARELPADVRITRVVNFELELTRPKHVGKNAYRHDHGPKSYDRVLRLYTNAGIEGLGPCWSSASACAELLGRSPLELLDLTAAEVRSPLGRQTAALWDLAGRILKRPVYDLLGGKGRQRVPVYDGSIYFIDLRPPHRSDWPDAVRRELDQSLASGHRAFKVKVGRGKHWMPMPDGDARDVEVVRLIRRHIGPGVPLHIDANDGYTPERVRGFLEQTADCRPGFVEEMFPMTVEAYLDLKAFMGARGWDILIADGENQRRPQEMATWVEAKAVDILQGDMNQFGFEDILAEAAMAHRHSAWIAPHNWGSLLGYYLQLHTGRAVGNFYAAEQDPLHCPAVVAEGFELRDGLATVPDAPGLGLKLDDEALERLACVHFDLKA